MHHAHDKSVRDVYSIGGLQYHTNVPPEIMKDVEKETFDFKAWQEQAYQPSNANFVAHKVELGDESSK